MQIHPDESQASQVPQAQVIRESNFHQALQLATEQGDKAAFNLVLSMVTNSAKELDEFNLPYSQAYKTKSNLEKNLFVRTKVMYGKVPVERSIEQNVCIQQGQKASVHLDIALKPEPLVAEQYDLPADLFDNLDFNARIRLLNESEQTESTAENPRVSAPSTPSKNNPPEIDVDAWFNTLQQARAFAAMA